MRSHCNAKKWIANETEDINFASTRWWRWTSSLNTSYGIQCSMFIVRHRGSWQCKYLFIDTTRRFLSSPASEFRWWIVRIFFPSDNTDSVVAVLRCVWYRVRCAHRAWYESIKCFPIIGNYQSRILNLAKCVHCSRFCWRQQSQRNRIGSVVERYRWIERISLRLRILAENPE